LLIGPAYVSTPVRSWNVTPFPRSAAAVPTSWLSATTVAPLSPLANALTTAANGVDSGEPAGIEPARPTNEAVRSALALGAAETMPEIVDELTGCTVIDCCTC